jgi:hypothetical protein
MSVDPEISIPLPWREGIKGRGKQYHPHLNPPPSSLNYSGIFDKGEEIMVFPDGH